MLVLSTALGSLVAGSAELGRASLGAGGPQPSLSASAWSQRVAAPVKFQSGGSTVGVQGLAGKGKVRFAERFVLRRVRMNQARDISRKGVPIGDQLGPADKLADPGTNHVDADYWPVRFAYQFHKSPSLEDLRLAVSSQVIGERRHVAKACSRLIFTQTYRGDFGVAVGDTRHVCIDNRRGSLLEKASLMGNLLGDKDPLCKTSMGQLQALHVDNWNSVYGGAP